MGFAYATTASANSMADAHRSVLPVAADDGLVVQSAAHVPRVLPGVDVHDVSAAAPAASGVVGAVIRLVPVPAEIEELGGDVPVPDLRSATEVPGDAVDPVA